MASGMVRPGGSQLTYRQNEEGDYVYHPSGQFRMSQQEATSANEANRATRRGSYSASVGEVPGFGGAGGSATPYGGTSPTSGIVANTGAGGGNVPLSRGSYEDQQAMLLKAKLANDAMGRVTGAMGSTSGGGPAPTVNYGDNGQAAAARAAAFARAKEQAGQTAASAMRTLEEVAGRRGIRGSTIESRMIADVTQRGAGDVQDFTREQLIRDLENTQHIADMSYTGGIQQRGQDMSAKQALLSILAGLY